MTRRPDPPTLASDPIGLSAVSCADPRPDASIASSAALVPAFYDDLSLSLAEAWRLLATGVTDRRTPIHTPSLSTNGRDGSPEVRTVVLRAVNPAARQVRFHTDRRSAKFRELSADPRVSILAYDPRCKVQLRIKADASLHFADSIAEAAWAASQHRSRICYAQPLAPGTEIATGGPADNPVASPERPTGYENFVAVIATVHSIEWLYLAHAGHRRARFTWLDGRLLATWLAP